MRWEGGRGSRCKRFREKSLAGRFVKELMRAVSLARKELATEESVTHCPLILYEATERGPD